MDHLRNSLAVAFIFSLVIFPSCQKPEKAVQDKSGKEQSNARPGKPAEEIRFSAEAIKNLNLVVGPVALSPVNEKITATATISHNQDRFFQVTPRIDGRVLAVYASVGKSVKQGEKLALLDSTSLGETASGFLKAQTLVALAKADYEREKSLFDQKIAAKKDMLAAEAKYEEAQADLRSLAEKLRLYGLTEEQISKLKSADSYSHFTIVAPASGVVVEKDISQGEVVPMGKKVFAISDLSTVWILLDIYEKDLAKIKKGAEVTITVDAYPGARFHGIIDYIADVINPSTRTAQVRVKVPNPDRRLKPGMFANASIEGMVSREKSKALYVPSTALFEIHGKSTVFVEESVNQFKPREVDVASVSGDQAEITGGLKPGDRIVVDGGIYLKSTLLKEELGDTD